MSWPMGFIQDHYFEGAIKDSCRQCEKTLCPYCEEEERMCEYCDEDR